MESFSRRRSISKIRLSDTRRAAERTLAREAQAEVSTPPIFEILPKYISLFGDNSRPISYTLVDGISLSTN
jgi:hypothetical protein